MDGHKFDMQLVEIYFGKMYSTCILVLNHSGTAVAHPTKLPTLNNTFCIDISISKLVKNNISLYCRHITRCMVGMLTNDVVQTVAG